MAPKRKRAASPSAFITIAEDPREYKLASANDAEHNYRMQFFYEIEKEPGVPERIFTATNARGEIVGVAKATRECQDGTVLNLKLLSVDARYRDRTHPNFVHLEDGGLGKRLLQTVLEEGRRDGFRDMCIDVPVAADFYRRNGFVSRDPRMAEMWLQTPFSRVSNSSEKRKKSKWKGRLAAARRS